MIQFTVPGLPQGKGRARFSTRGKSVRAFTPAKTVAYEGLIALAGEKAMEGCALLEGPVHLVVDATFPIPVSWNKAKKLAAQSGLSWHTSKPDADNIMKAVGDGLNEVVWKDDSQIVMARIIKQYGPTPGLLVTVEPLA